jgi:hypothetical protein
LASRRSVAAIRGRRHLLLLIRPRGFGVRVSWSRCGWTCGCLATTPTANVRYLARAPQRFQFSITGAGASDSMDTGLGGLALCPFETSKGGMEPLTIALSFDGVSIIEGRRALERRFVYPVRIGTKLLDLGIRWPPPYNRGRSLPSPAPDSRGHPKNSFRSWRRRWRAPDPLSTPLATANSRPRTAVGSAGAIGNTLKRQPESGLQNRNASGFQMLDKANPGLVTSPRSEALPHDRKAVVVAGSVPSLKSGSAVLIEGNDHIASRKETAPRFWRAAKLHLLGGLPDWPCPAAH